MFGNLSYLVWMLVFCIPPIGYLWIRKWNVLNRNRHTILLMVLLGLLFYIIPNPVIRGWDTWFYSDDKIIGRVFGAPIEDLVFAVLVALAIASATISFIDSKRKGKHRWLFGEPL